nr:putative integron gene cassette protein [uncultured bacterium]
MRSIVFAVLLLCSLSVFAWPTETSDKAWRSGWGQGVAEAQVTHGSGNEIYVACEDGSGIDSSISFMLAGDGPKSGEILMIFDKGEPESIQVGADGNITSNSHASDSTFRYVLRLTLKA